MSRILRVNMADLTAKLERVPKKYQTMGGRWLTSRLLADEVPATCDALGPNNRLVFAPGIVSGTAAPSSSRISVGGKSPMTGGIKESNSGGVASRQLARLGIKAVVVEGQARDPRTFWLLRVARDKAELLPADKFTGKGLYETYPMLLDEFGPKTGIMSIGLTGEKQMLNSGICINDPENRPSRYAGRGGLGAVMGAKGLKAIVLDEQPLQFIRITGRALFVFQIFVEQRQGVVA